MAQQTALDFYIDKINEWFEDACIHCELCKEDNKIYKQAKQMEKEQIMSVIRFVRYNNKPSKSVQDLCEQYYKETF